MNYGPITAQILLHGSGLPEDVLVTSYSAHEAISQLYDIRVQFCTEDRDFRIEDCLRKRLLLELADRFGSPRYLDGVVNDASFVKVAGKKLHFRVRLRPALAALALRVDSRIFQDQTVEEIATTLLQEAGLADKVEFRLTREPDTRPYTVQYRESALNFMTRLFEDEGYFYFFLHDDAGHRMVVADASNVFDNHGLVGDPVQLSLAQTALTLGEPLTRFSRKRSLRTTHVVLRDFDFESPRRPAEAIIAAEDVWPAPHFDYPGGFTKPARGEALAATRIKQLRSDADVCAGSSKQPLVSVARSVLVDGNAETDLNGTYVVTAVETFGHQSGDGADGAPNVLAENRFFAIPAGTDYQPPRRAPRPKIPGLQTAVVTGDDNDPQAICVDKYGRIKVRFHWDRVGQFDDKSSCWVRVVQLPLGGSMILPRVGWEVSVAFLEGDPDRPLVMGRVYNAQKTPPLALPGSSTFGSIKSMSSPGGAGSNEITLGDAGGSQGFAIKAQKDLNASTGFDQTEEVTVNDEHHVNGNLSRSVKVNDAMNVGANQSVNVGAHTKLDVTGNQTQTVGGNDQFDVKGNLLEKITGDRSYTVAGNSLTIDNGEMRTLTGNYTRTVGALELAAVGGSVTENIVTTSASNVGAVRMFVTGGSVGEVVQGAKARTVSGAEALSVKGNSEVKCEGAATHVVGAVHNQKITGDLVIKGKKVQVVSGSGKLKVGGTVLNLSGGSLKMKGSKIVVKAALVKKSGNLKVGG